MGRSPKSRLMHNVPNGDGAPRGAVVLSRQWRFREGGAEHEAAVHVTRGGDNGGEGEVRVSIDGKRVAEVSCLGWGFRRNRTTVLTDVEVVDVMWDVLIEPMGWAVFGAPMGCHYCYFYDALHITI
uniref:Uncharacterized protein n=1 Tax=Oryza meridionalis TaxID=40149 RepID=A0A0E0D6Q6_9ORYZ